MSEITTLIDGRRVQAEECLDLELALCGATHTERPELFERRGEWYVTCHCCGGDMDHYWSPSGHGVDPDGGHYQCGPCKGRGIFKIQMP